MAYIEFDKITHNSITAYIAGLDLEYKESNNRYAMFYIKKSDESEDEYNHCGAYGIANGYESSKDFGCICEFANLEEGTNYDIKVSIYNIAGVGSVTLTKSQETTALTPDIKYFECFREQSDIEGAFIACCNFEVYDVNKENAVYTIEARQSGTTQFYEKESKDFVHYSVKTKVYDDYDTGGFKYKANGTIKVLMYNEEDYASKLYDIRLIVDNNAKSDIAVQEKILFVQNLITEISGSSELVESSFDDEGYYCSLKIIFDLLRPLPENADIVYYMQDASGQLISDTFDSGNTFITIDDAINQLYDSSTDKFYIFAQEHNLENVSAWEAPLQFGVGVTVYDSDGFSMYTDWLSCTVDLPAIQPQITGFNAAQSEKGEKKILCNISLFNITQGETVYEIWCKYINETDTEDWYIKDSGYVSREEFSRNISVDNFGLYQVQLKVYTGDLSTSLTVDVEVALLDNQRPLDWEWTTAIKDGETLAIVKSEVHPVTAEEWNLFIRRMNDFRKYVTTVLGWSNVTGNGYTLQNAQKGIEFKDYYNAAVTAMQEMDWVGANLKPIDTGTELKPELLSLLASELNAIP